MAAAVDKLAAIAAKRRDVDVPRDMKLVPLEDVKVAAECADAAGSLLEVVREGVMVAAEFKRASPSKGDINLEVSLEEQVAAYTSAGARVVSVLT